MIYDEYPVHARLQPFVKVIYSFEGEAVITDFIPWRILPDTCVEIVLHIQSPYITTFANGKKAQQPQSFVMAQMKQFVEIEPSGKTCFIAVRFTAAGAHHFFSMPVSGFSGEQVPVSEVWGDLTTELEDKLHSPLSTAYKAEIVQRSLLLQLDCNGYYDHMVYHCLQTIYARNGVISVGELATQKGISTRHLLRRFDRFVGASPKEFSKNVRFLHACRLLRSGQSCSLIDTAYTSGYFDQAHFIHDFKVFSGMTPGEFLHAENIFF